MDATCQIVVGGATLAAGAFFYRLVAHKKGEPESYDPHDVYPSVNTEWYADDLLTYGQAMPRGVSLQVMERLPGQAADVYRVQIDGRHYMEITGQQLEHWRRYGTFY